MKIKLLVDEVIANVIENGHSIGPKHCIAGETVQVYEGAGDLLIAFNKAVKVQERIVTKELETEEVEPEVKEKKTKKPKAPKVPKSKTPEPEYNNIWDNISDPISEPVSKKQSKKK